MINAKEQKAHLSSPLGSSSPREENRQSLPVCSCTFRVYSLCRSIKHFVTSLVNKSASFFFNFKNKSDSLTEPGKILLKRRKQITHGLLDSVLVAKPVARKTHEEDCRYYRRCILGLVVDWRGTTSLADVRWEVVSVLVLLFFSPALPVRSVDGWLE